MNPNALGYPFDPPPKWVRQMRERGELSTEGLDLQLALFHRADTRRLAARRPTPKLRLESLAAMLRRPSDAKGLASLSRFLALERSRGRLDYVVEGNAHTGYVYVFTLCLDAPGLSDPVPTSTGLAVPTSSDRETRPDAREAADDGASRSDHADNADGRFVPPTARPVPTSGESSGPHGQRESGDTGQADVPTSSEVRERANPSRTRTRNAGVRVDDAHARETTSELIASTDRLLALARTQTGFDGNGHEADLVLELVETFDATPVEEPEPPLCRYDHRAPWRTRNGRLVCRVCHPPAPGAEAT